MKLRCVGVCELFWPEISLDSFLSTDSSELQSNFPHRVSGLSSPTVPPLPRTTWAAIYIEEHIWCDTNKHKNWLSETDKCVPVWPVGYVCGLPVWTIDDEGLRTVGTAASKTQWWTGSHLHLQLGGLEVQTQLVVCYIKTWSIHCGHS